MSEAGEIPVSPSEIKPPQNKGMTRRQFLGLGGRTVVAAVAASALPSFLKQSSEAQAAPPQQSPTPTAEAPVKTKEVEPAGSTVPLLVDFTPLPDEAKQAKEKGLLVEKVSSFDLPAFFQRVTEANYAELEAKYQQETKSSFLLYGEGGRKWLFEKKLIKEALCLSLAYQWSFHGLDVVQSMRNLREIGNTSVTEERYFDKDGKEINLQDYDARTLMDLETKGEISRKSVVIKEGANYPLQPYEILPLHDFMTGLEESQTRDEWGNPYYYVTLDHRRLAEALEKCPDKIINCSFNVGRIPLRLGLALADGQLADKSSGWTEGEYSGTPQDVKNGLRQYWPPAVALETAYKDPKNLQVLKELAQLLPDKIIVIASGNSRAELPADWQPPENLILVAAWNSQVFIAEDIPGEKPEHDFLGKAGQLYYLDPDKAGGDGRFSSLATGMVAEWLAEQGVKTPQEARKLLDEHSKIQKATGQQILDIGSIPNLEGYNHWDDPAKYQSPSNS